MSDNLILNSIYNVNHSRKGIFKIKVLEVQDECVIGEIVKGTTKALLQENIIYTGETISIRKILSSFEKVL